MDAITAAILAALPVLATDTLKTSVKDAYDALKEIIRGKWSQSHGLVKAIDAIEQNPKSDAHATLLSEEIEASGVSGDPDVVQAWSKLLKELRREGIEVASDAAFRVRIDSSNFQGAVVRGTVSIGSMTFGAPVDGKEIRRSGGGRVIGDKE